MTVNIFHTADGTLDAAERAALEALAARLKAQSSKVMLHLHGGLVKEAEGLAAATRLGGPAPHGYGLGPEWEQVYVVWRTGVLETLKKNWSDLLKNDRLYKTLLEKLIGFASSKLEGQGGGRSAFAATQLTPNEIRDRLRKDADRDPFADVDAQIGRGGPTGRGADTTSQTETEIGAEFALQLQLDSDFTGAAEDIAAALTVDPTTGRSPQPRGDAAAGRDSFERLDTDIRAELEATVPTGPDGRFLFTAVEVVEFLIKHATAIVIRIIRRFRAGRDHGFYATVLEEFVREMYLDLIGAAIWGMMKKDAADHFLNDGFGTALIKAFAEGRPSLVAVCGHSAGAIWATALIKAVAAMLGPPDMRVVFLAPAVRMDLIAEILDPKPRFIKAFRMFTMRDELERIDPVLGPGTAAVYPSSLLYLISGVLEDENAEAFPDAPLLGMQRFLGEDSAWLSDDKQIAAVRRVMGFLKGAGSSIVWSTTEGEAGLSSSALAHGAFDDDQPTLKSVATFFA